LSAIHHPKDWLHRQLLEKQDQRGGRWKSQWTLLLDNENAGKLSGQIDVHVHFYEGGNVHLKTKKEPELTIDIKDKGQQLAKLLATKIEAEESNFEGAIEEAFRQLNDSVFRSLRMALPHTKTKIKWETFVQQSRLAARNAGGQ
ncbi:MAG: hypothetical protein EZS28_042319, partial [Streblomastix strix]